MSLLVAGDTNVQSRLVCCAGCLYSKAVVASSGFLESLTLRCGMSDCFLARVLKALPSSVRALNISENS